MTDPHPVRWMRDVEVFLWTMSSRKRLRLGRRTKEGVGLRGFSRPRCTNGWADGMGLGNHGLGTRLSEMQGKLQKYPHRFEAVLSVQGYHGHFACQDFTGGGSFARVVILE